jgi:hypothetical protein
MSDDIFPPIPPSLSTGTASLGLMPTMGSSAAFPSGGTSERGTEMVRSSTGYGPTDEPKTRKVHKNSVEPESKTGPVSWQDRLSGRLAQDSRGHMKWVCKRHHLLVSGPVGLTFHS